MKTQYKDYYALLGVEARRHPGADQDGLPQAGQAIPPGREQQPVMPLSGSGRSPKPTTRSPTRTGVAGTTGSTAPAPAPARRWRHMVRVHRSGHRNPHRERVREQQRLASSQPDPESAGRHLAGNPPLAPGNTPGRHHHRQRHRRQANPARPPRPRPLERRWRAICRDHDQRRRTPPQPERGTRHPPARSRPRPGPRTRHQGHQPPGPLPQQALQDPRRTARPDRRARRPASAGPQPRSPAPPSSPTPASSAPWPRP